jgi:hypothetical protein
MLASIISHGKHPKVEFRRRCRSNAVAIRFCDLMSSTLPASGGSIYIALHPWMPSRDYRIVALIRFTVEVRITDISASQNSHLEIILAVPSYSGQLSISLCTVQD